MLESVLVVNKNLSNTVRPNAELKSSDLQSGIPSKLKTYIYFPPLNIAFPE